MVNSTTIFEYDGTLSTSFTPSIINATLNRDMYEFSPLGSKSIIEEKIQGRDEPYFYDVDYEPLSFSMTIAFEDFATQEQVRDIISWLYSPKKPRLLRFQEYNMNFFGIFIGQPKFYYFGNNISGYKFIGYIEVEFRANAPYGWTELIQNTNHTGSFDVYPSFSIKNNYEGPNEVVLSHGTNGSSFTYNLKEDEKITFNGYTKTIVSEDWTEQNFTILESNPYQNWSKDYLLFNPGENLVTASSEQDALNFEVYNEQGDGLFNFNESTKYTETINLGDFTAQQNIKRIVLTFNQNIEEPILIELYYKIDNGDEVDWLTGFDSIKIGGQTTEKVLTEIPFNSAGSNVKLVFKVDSLPDSSVINISIESIANTLEVTYSYRAPKIL